MLGWLASSLVSPQKMLWPSDWAMATWSEITRTFGWTTSSALVESQGLLNVQPTTSEFITANTLRMLVSCVLQVKA